MKRTNGAVSSRRRAVLVAALAGCCAVAAAHDSVSSGADLEQTLEPARQAWLALGDEETERGHWLAAAQALRMAAGLDDVAAQQRLGWMHWIGEPLYGAGPWNRAEALYWFRRAEALGGTVAQVMLRHTTLAHQRDP